MAQDEQVPLYPEGGSLEEDLRRIARFSNNSTGATTQNGANGATAPPATTTTAPVVDSGDPDTDELIHRMLREDAEEDNTGGDDNESAQDEPDPEAERRNIIESYFSCIRTSNSELISAFIDGGIVTPNTKSDTGETPLVAAVRANHVRIVQQLVDYGADVNEMTEEVCLSFPENTEKCDIRICLTHFSPSIESTTGRMVQRKVSKTRL